VVVAVLLAATAFGLWRSRRDGRLRPAGRPQRGNGIPLGQDPVPLGQGGDAAPLGQGGDAAPVDADVLAALGVEPGAPATLVQFSSAFCAPCRATRRVLHDVTGLLDGVRHVEVDAESHLDAVRALGIWRTPTVLVVDADGRVVQRASGVPAKAQVIAALAPLVDGARS
jgi:thiol-disulfide isomerase/thioredoxin